MRKGSGITSREQSQQGECQGACRRQAGKVAQLREQKGREIFPQIGQSDCPSSNRDQYECLM